VFARAPKRPRRPSRCARSNLFVTASLASVLQLNGGRSADDPAVAIGDTVRVRYPTGDRKTLQLIISKTKSDIVNGVVHCDAPIAKALLGAEEGDEVEVLTGRYVRPAVVESIMKAAM
jgi:transcription elongation GreA/GreB family factor